MSYEKNQFKVGNSLPVWDIQSQSPVGVYPGAGSDGIDGE
jgi:hypothetical protein